MVDLFKRLDAGRPPVEEVIEPPPTEAVIKPPRKELEPAQKLLDWLQRWTKDTVCVREIHIYGPYATRDRKSAIAAARILVKNGWLTPIKMRRYDANKWQIIRKLIVQPNVAQNVA